MSFKYGRRLSLPSSVSTGYRSLGLRYKIQTFTLSVLDTQRKNMAILWTFPSGDKTC